MPKQIRLKEVRTRGDLAAMLGVPVAAVNLVSLTEAPCKTKSCPLPAAAWNHGRCVLCSQSWFPREAMRNRRGYGLFGPQFLRSFGGRSNPRKTCCCASALCEKIGYSHAGMFRFPTDPAKSAEAARLLGIESPEKRQKIVEKPMAHQMAPWHFSNRHRYRNADGNWRLRRESSYQDDDGNVFSFPPPNFSLQRFIDEEVLLTGFAQEVVNDSLPDWVRVVVRAQEAGADTSLGRNCGEGGHLDIGRATRSDWDGWCVNAEGSGAVSPGAGPPNETAVIGKEEALIDDEGGAADDRSAIDAFLHGRAHRSASIMETEKPSPLSEGSSDECANNQTKTSDEKTDVVDCGRGDTTLIWEQWFFLLLQYRARKKDYRVPQKYYCTIEGQRVNLGKFVCDLREYKRWLQEENTNDDGEELPKEEQVQHDILTPERIEVLDSVGFSWDDCGRCLSWEKRYNELKNYHSEHGNSDPRDKPSLFNWCVRQRTANKKMARRAASVPKAKEELDEKKRLWAERKAKLDELGFVWGTNASWEERFESLKRFRAEHGHCNVPKSYCVTLYHWVKGNRADYIEYTQEGKGPLTPEKISALECVGFQWRVYKPRSNTRREVLDSEEDSESGHE